VAAHELMLLALSEHATLVITTADAGAVTLDKPG
jgi:hypothetical protein